ncbi:MAG: bifunctional folylpolyglutamate synthase/dihydrofolate synthase [Acidimicrobiia bacterium]
MTLAEALAWLDGHVNLETGVGFPHPPTGGPAGTGPKGRERGAPTLDRIRALTELLGTPQAEFPTVHLTGTNGKTSTARMAACVLEATGRSVGLATSPHLEAVNERIGWNGEPIDDASLARVPTQIAVVEEFLPESPSYFEIMVAAAFTYFADVAVHVAVVEVGMGGTWDATNVVDAEVAVVTNVGLDHTAFLGTTREEIAADKAGIIRPGAHLVLGETDPALVDIFTARDPAVVWLRDRDFGVRAGRLAHGGHLVDLFTPRGEYRDVFVPLHGAHQVDNAAIALAAAQAHVDAPFDDDTVQGGFAIATSPGRLEVVGTQPLILLDGAHNTAGAAALRRALAEEFAPRPRTFVVGLLRDKDATEMLDALDVAAAERLVCTRPPTPRALDPNELAEAALALGVDEARIDVLPDVDRAVSRAQDVTVAEGQIVVTGSLYLVGAARARLRTR